MSLHHTSWGDLLATSGPHYPRGIRNALRNFWRWFCGPNP